MTAVLKIPACKQHFLQKIPVNPPALIMQEQLQQTDKLRLFRSVSACDPLSVPCYGKFPKRLYI